MPFGRRPSYRNPDLPQPEVCDFCGTLVPRQELAEVQVNGLRGRMICARHEPSITELGFRDHLANQGRRPQQIPTRLPPYGASKWLEEEEA